MRNLSEASAARLRVVQKEVEVSQVIPEDDPEETPQEEPDDDDDDLVAEFESIGEAPLDPVTEEDDDGDAGPEGIEGKK